MGIITKTVTITVGLSGVRLVTTKNTALARYVILQASARLGNAGEVFHAAGLLSGEGMELTEGIPYMLDAGPNDFIDLYEIVVLAVNDGDMVDVIAAFDSDKYAAAYTANWS